MSDRMRRLRAWSRRRFTALRSGEGGMSLAEMLVAVTILGLAIPVIIAGLGTASMASDRHRKQATADTVLKSYGEAIKDAVRRNVAPFTYVDCAPASTYTNPDLATATGWSAPTGYSVSISGVQYSASSGFSSSCDTGAPYVNTQRLSLTAVSDDGRGTETLEIVVRKP